MRLTHSGMSRRTRRRPSVRPQWPQASTDAARAATACDMERAYADGLVRAIGGLLQFVKGQIESGA